MCTHKKTSRNLGFVLIEALIALVLISIGLVAVAKLQVMSMSGSGEAKARSEAMALSQKKLEELRNIVIRTQFTTDPLTTGSASVTGTNATFAMTWTVSALSAPEQRLLQLTTQWSDRTGTQTLNLDSLVAWDDPGSQGKLSAPPNTQLISPTGDARRGTGETVSLTGATSNGNGTYTKVDSATHITYLLSSNGTVLLYLKPKGTVEQSFATISGKIYFDQNATIPSSANVRVRLSSEGECIYDNSVDTLTSNGVVTGGSNSYKYFDYTCYVGPGWYGNVGVTVDDSVNGGDPTICVGDPSYNGGVSDNTLISPNSAVSGTRSYRGFRGTAGSYLSTGMGGGTHYGTTAGLTGPFAGLPVPSSYHPYYATINTNDTTNYFDQNFLITRITGQETCALKMTGGTVFTRNAGKYFCISPDSETAYADVCPSIWPNFENQVGNGDGVILTVIAGGSGTGTLTSSPSGINCGSTCVASFTSGASVTLSAAPTGGSTFAGWSGGGCSGTGTCVVTLSAATAVTATFTAAVTNYALTVVPAGSGSGTVTSSPAGISCTPTCTASFVSGTSVTLSATPGNGSTFAGWSGGGCTGTGTCAVTLSADTSITATFNTAPAYSVTVALAGAGTGGVTSSIGGISCNPTCTSTGLVANDVVTLTATPTGGSTFTGWGGSCSGTGSCVVIVTGAMNVTATFAAPVPTYALTVSKAGAGTGTVTSSPSGISCGSGSGCTATYVSGTTVTLTAVASTGGFTGWSGACSGTSTCVVTMSAAQSVTATFGACNTPIEGSAVDKNGTVTVAPTSAGSCAMQGGNSVGYNCTITAPVGTSLTLTNSRTTGQTLVYSYTKSTVANCSSQTFNFP